MVGQIISHYKILEKLGEGGMGVVYQAQDLKLDRPVALKFLPPEFTRDPIAKQRFINEAKSASALDHPNICTVYEIGETPEGQLYIAMACYDGETVQQSINRHQLAMKDCIGYASQIAEGLSAAHKKGIVHRDIKSSNLLITETGQVKIMDFGLAKSTATRMMTKTGATVGTVPYMSPEQARGEKVDHRTDIWSLGVVLYEMIVGKLPFQSAYSEAVVYSILNENPPALGTLRRDVPKQVEALVSKCLEKDPDRRFQKTEELFAELRRLSSVLESDRAQSRLASLFSRRRRPWSIAAGTALLVIILLMFAIPLRNTRDASIDSIAVLPLQNFSQDPEQEYFSDGMTEALITDLARISSLRVISRTSIMRYKGSQKSTPEIARDLNVDALIEGSVQRVGDRVRVTAQLIHAESDKHLWANSYERNVTDILALQSEIALAIAKEIRATLSPLEETRLTTVGSVNKQAYEAYLKGRYHWNKRTAESLNKAIEFFNQAIQFDPAYARAHAGLADSYIILGVYDELPPAKSFPVGKAAAQKALEIDPSIAEAHASLGDINIHFEWDWEAAKEHLTNAIALDANYAVGHHWFSEYLTAIGRHDEAIAETKTARELDPLSPIISTWVGWNYYCAQKYDSAIVELNRTLEIDKDFPWAHFYLGWCYRQMGKLQEAINKLQLANRLYENPHMLSSLGHAYALGGRTQEAEKVLDQLSGLSKRRFVSAYNFAFVTLGLKKTDQTFEWLEKAFRERSSRLYSLGVDPVWLPLRTDPRFSELLKKMGLPASTRAGRGMTMDNARPGESARSRNSVAVLPFKNMSPDKEQEYFCDGITEAIITDLAKLSELIVMSPAAVSRFKGASTDLAVVSRQLNVQYVIEGSVQRMGTALRVSAQLSDAETGVQVWADRFDRNIRDVFKVQDDIARKITETLQLKVSPVGEKNRLTQNLDAYDLYLRGRYYLKKQSVKEIDRAIQLLEQTVAIDPRFATALASLGMAYTHKSFYGDPLKKEWEEKAVVTVEKAIAIDPNLAEAYVAKGLLLWTPANRFPHEKAIAAFRRAIELKPNLDEAHEWLGLVYYHVGLMEAGLEECRRALQINPSSAFAQSRVGINLLYAGRYEEALAELRKVPEGFSPQIVPVQTAIALFYLGRMSEAKTILQEAHKQLPEDPVLLSAQALFFAREGKSDLAMKKLQLAEKKEKTYLGHFHHAAYNIGSSYALMKKNAEAVDWLRKSAEGGFPCYPKYESDPNLENIRQDAQFLQFMKDLKKQWEYYKTV